jgi:hypothetical protein
MGVVARQMERAFLLRAGRNLREYGDPYEFVVTVTAEPGGCAYLQGAAGEAYSGLRQELKEKLREMGFKSMRWERRKNQRKVVNTEIRQ